jgi:hypothetical protein
MKPKAEEANVRHFTSNQALPASMARRPITAAAVWSRPKLG